MDGKTITALMIGGIALAVGVGRLVSRALQIAAAAKHGAKGDAGPARALYR